MKLKVKITNSTSNDIPRYGTEKSSGLDLRAYISTHSAVNKHAYKANKGVGRTITILPGGRCLIPTGICIALPEGYEAQVRPRSGLALKKGITVLNSPGTIDEDYRGDIGVILINHGKDPFTVTNGERIAQLVIAPYVQAELIQVGDLDQTDRGEGGFGSTD